MYLLITVSEGRRSWIKYAFLPPAPFRTCGIAFNFELHHVSLFVIHNMFDINLRKEKCNEIFKVTLVFRCTQVAQHVTILACFLFALSANCHQQKFPDDSPIIAGMKNNDDKEYRELTQHFC